jgi:hypothetical protein
MQGWRLVVFLLLPVVSGIVAMVGMRSNIAPVGWKRGAFMLGPIVGLGLSFSAFVVVIMVSIASGH